MGKIIAAAIFSLFLLCGCETTANVSSRSGTAASKPDSVTVGGEIQVRGQYLGGD